MGYFKLESLELRRLKINLTTIFKISNNYTDINISDILIISNNCRIRGNCKKINEIDASMQSRSQLFKASMQSQSQYIKHRCSLNVNNNSIV